MQSGRHIKGLANFSWKQQKHHVLSVILLLTAAGLAWSIKSTMESVALRAFSDGAGISRSVLDPDLRTTLWSGPAPAPTSFKLPAGSSDPCFSPDGLTMVFAIKLGNSETTNLFFCAWTGSQWAKPKKVTADKPATGNMVGPSFSTDGKYLFFASDRAGGEGGYDLWMSGWRNGKCKGARNLGPSINTAANESGPAVSSSGKRLFFSSDRTKDGKAAKGADHDIFVAKRTSEADAQPEFGDVLKIDALSSKYEERQPTLTRRGDLLYFASNRKGGVGGFDIYCSRVQNGEVAAPENLTAQINSSGDDRAPALRFEGFELVFSVDGRIHSSVMREVTATLDLRRLHRLLQLIERMKWWILGAILAAMILYYLLRHWRDLTNMFQKCLVASVIVHLLLMLIMAGKLIATEISETSKAVSMEVAIDADALAQEKMALDMQEDVVEMTPSDTDLLVEKVEQDVEMPEFTPEELESDQPIATESVEETFVAMATTSKIEEEAPADAVQADLEMAELPELELPKLEVEMEEPSHTPVEPESQELVEPKPNSIQQEMEVAFEEQAVDAEPVKTPTEDVSRMIKPTPAREPTEAQPTTEMSIVENTNRPPEEVEAPSEAVQVVELVDIDAPEIQMTMEMPEEYIESDQPAKQPTMETASLNRKTAVEFVEIAENVTSHSAPAQQVTELIVGNFAKATPTRTKTSGVVGTVRERATREQPMRKSSSLPGSELVEQMERVPERVGVSSNLEMPVARKAGSGTQPKVAANVRGVEVAFQEQGRLVARAAGQPGVEAQAVARASSAPSAVTGGTIVVPFAGLESRGRPPKTVGSGKKLTLQFKSAMPGDMLKINAPGKLDVPSANGELISPAVLRNLGSLSTEVVQGLGGSDNTQEAIRSALSWFDKNQERNGRWDIDKHGGEEGHDVAATSLILLCYYGWGATHVDDSEYRGTVAKAIKWLVDQMEDGSEQEPAGRLVGKGGNTYDHAMATIALCEAYTLTKDPKLLEPARKAVAYLVDGQHPEKGGWRYEPRDDSDILVTGWVYLALKSARMGGIKVDQAVFDRADKWIDKCAGTPGSGVYSYQPGYKHRSGTMIATGMFSRQLAGVAPTDPRMQKTAAYLHAHPFKPENLDYYYLYYGTLALYQHQGRNWHAWNARMKEIVPGRQRKTGRQSGSWDPSGHLGPRMGRAVTTAMCTLSLEVYYRILPMYGFRDDED